MFWKAEESGSGYLICFWLLHFILPLSSLPTQQLHYSQCALTGIGARFIGTMIFVAFLPPRPVRSSGSYNTDTLWRLSVTYPETFKEILQNSGTKPPKPGTDHRPTPEALILHKAIEILASMKQIFSDTDFSRDGISLFALSLLSTKGVN